MGFSIEKKNVTLISDSSKSEISDKKTSLNQFVPVGAHLLEIIDLKKTAWSYKITIFFHYLQN